MQGGATIVQKNCFRKIGLAILTRGFQSLRGQVIKVDQGQAGLLRQDKEVANGIENYLADALPNARIGIQIKSFLCRLTVYEKDALAGYFDRRDSEGVANA